MKHGSELESHSRTVAGVFDSAKEIRELIRIHNRAPGFGIGPDLQPEELPAQSRALPDPAIPLELA